VGEGVNPLANEEKESADKQKIIYGARTIQVVRIVQARIIGRG
jgi:hypothetical protein